MIYLDYCATTPPLKKCLDYLYDEPNHLFFNPSSPYPPAKKISKQIEKIRNSIAKELNTNPDSLFFTSGATESNNIVLKSFEHSRVICDKANHSSIYETAKFFKNTHLIDLSKNPMSIIQEIKNVLKPGDLVSLIHINNETGEVLDINAISHDLKKNHKIYLHVDAVQSFLKTPIDLSNLPIDFLSASFHKVNGLKGGGILFARDQDLLKPLYRGGGQESGLRPGTPNTSSILSFQFALTHWQNERKANMDKIRELNQFLRQTLAKELPGCQFYQAPTLSPYILNVSIPKTKSEVVVRILGDRGIYLSNASACHSKKKNNRVLSSKKCSPDYIAGAIRISLSPRTTKADLLTLVEALISIRKDFFNLL